MHHSSTFSTHTFLGVHLRMYYVHVLCTANIATSHSDAQLPSLNHQILLRTLACLPVRSGETPSSIRPSPLPTTSKPLCVQSRHLPTSQSCHTRIRDATIRCDVEDIPISLRATKCRRRTTNEHGVIRTSSNQSLRLSFEIQFHHAGRRRRQPDIACAIESKIIGLPAPFVQWKRSGLEDDFNRLDSSGISGMIRDSSQKRRLETVVEVEIAVANVHSIDSKLYRRGRVWLQFRVVQEDRPCPARSIDAIDEPCTRICGEQDPRGARHCSHAIEELSRRDVYDLVHRD